MIKCNETDEEVRDSNEMNIWDLTAQSCEVKFTVVVECGLSFQFNIHISCDEEILGKSAPGSRL